MQILFRAEGHTLDWGDSQMKSITVLGILLAVLGIFALVYQGFSYTRQEKVLDVGPIHATRDDTQRVPLPPIVGGLALLGATALLVIGAKQKA
jgi:nitric oxide reductase large subunit